ncbi:MAG: glycosyltransferase family 4 protein [Pseudomonadota bacterium]|nr:glycosyltransferase family 4 protein [Pseudomonadota bacterium]
MLTTIPVAGDDRLQVLEIIGNSVVGGMESWVAQLVRNLPPDRVRVVCICPFESSFTADLREGGADVYIAPIADEPTWDTIQLAATLMRMHRIQVMHAHLPNAHLLASLLGSITGVPALATVHGGKLSLRELELLRLGSTHVSVICQAARLHALAMGVPNERVHFIPNGVDCDFLALPDESAPIRGALGIAQDAPLVAFVGRLSPEKGPDDFIRMASLVHHRLPECQFVLVGEGPMLVELQLLARELKIDPQVHFAGLHTHMRAVYHTVDLVVSTSRTEGMPFALLEAMACGRAVVATAVGGVPEIVEAGTTGLLSWPNSPERSASAVLRLMQDHERRRLMGVAGQARARTRFPLSASVGPMLALLQSLAAESQPAAAIPLSQVGRTHSRA